jgi:hypothetical protein
MFLPLVLFVMAACTPAPQATQDATLPPDTAISSPPEETLQANEPIEDPFSPKPGDANLSRGNVFIQETSLLIRESYPPQISLTLKGDLPTRCHQLRAEIKEATSDNKINVEVYSIVNPDLICTQVLEPFEVSLGLGTFPTGHYTVYVNGELAGEFDS